MPLKVVPNLNDSMISLLLKSLQPVKEHISRRVKNRKQCPHSCNGKSIPSGYLPNMSAFCILSEKGRSVHEQEQRKSYLNPQLTETCTGDALKGLRSNYNATKMSHAGGWELLENQKGPMLSNNIIPKKPAISAF